MGNGGTPPCYGNVLAPKKEVEGKKRGERGGEAIKASPPPFLHNLPFLRSAEGR